MYNSIDDKLREVRRRSTIIKKKQERKTIFRLSGAAAASFVLMVAGIISFTGNGAEGMTHTSYGAFLLSAETGGYLLVAFLSFLAGTVATILLSIFRQKHRAKEDEEGLK